jgi:hypothetical protein
VLIWLTTPAFTNRLGAPISLAVAPSAISLRPIVFSSGRALAMAFPQEITLTGWNPLHTDGFSVDWRTHTINIEETTSLIPLGNQASLLSSAISPFHLGLSGGTSQKNL